MKKINVLSIYKTYYLDQPAELWEAMRQLHGYFIKPTKFLIAYIAFRSVVIFNFNENYFDHLYIAEDL